MNIGLIDVDGHNFPNMALMRLSAHHKTRGDNVEWWDGFKHYDRVLALDKMGITPFAQPYRDYDGGEPTIEQRRFARWVNNKALFRSCEFSEMKGGTREAIM